MTRASIVCVFYSGFYAQLTAEAKHPFVICLYAMVPFQFVPDPSVSFIRGSAVDFFNLLCNLPVFYLMCRYFPAYPFVIRSTRYAAESTKQPDRISMCLMFFFYCLIYGFMPYQAQPRLLSASSNFFKKDASISARSFSALSSLFSARSRSSSDISLSVFRLPRLS